MNAKAPGSLVRIIDATLREGTQAPGVTFSTFQSQEIAFALTALGVDIIECGHPAVSDAERARVAAVCRTLEGRGSVLAHARAQLEDIRAVAASGCDWVGIFLGVNHWSLSARLSNWSLQQALESIQRSVSFAVSVGLKVRFTVEDTSRTDPDCALQAYHAAIAAGASRICYADTVGCMTPGEVGKAIRLLRKAIPSTDVEVHLHDDRGLALAGALSAIEAGANWISTSVNGLGERCGIVDLAALWANLEDLGIRSLPDPVLMQDLSVRVAAYARTPIDARRPVTGRNAFVHSAKLHRRAVERDPQSYEWIDPRRLGRQHEYVGSSLPQDTRKLVTKPLTISATELRHHRHGPGVRYVMLDERFVDDCRQYCIVRHIPDLVDYGPGHIDDHVHTCDSLFLFLGGGPELEGLTVEVKLGGRTVVVASPASVFIPAGMQHSYRVISGSGLFMNHVLAGSYNDSLLDPLTIPVPEKEVA